MEKHLVRSTITCLLPAELQQKERKEEGVVNSDTETTLAFIAFSSVDTSRDSTYTRLRSMSDSIRYLKRKTFTEQPKYLFTAILFSIQRRYAVCFSIRVICRGLESHTSRCEKSGKRRDISSKIPNTESEPDGPRGQMREQTDPEWEFMNTILPKDSSLLHHAIQSCF
jgi:hypothetical protein